MCTGALIGTVLRSVEPYHLAQPAQCKKFQATLKNFQAAVEFFVTEETVVAVLF